LHGSDRLPFLPPLASPRSLCKLLAVGWWLVGWVDVVEAPRGLLIASNNAT